MPEEEKTVIEIQGVKLEVDLRTAKRIDNIRVGARVKVLVKEYSSHKVHHGVVVGFEPFQELPTIVVCYYKIGYKTVDLEFLNYNKDTKDVEIIVAYDEDPAFLKKEVEEAFNRMLQAKQREITEIHDKLEYFRSNFKAYWSEVEKTPPKTEREGADIPF